MKQYIVKNQQNIFDLAIQLYGSHEYAVKLIEDNEVLTDVNQVIHPNTVINYEQQKDVRTADFRARNKVLATEAVLPEEEQGIIIPPDAFVYVVNVADNETIQLPMSSTNDSLYNCMVYFGDDTGVHVVSSYADLAREHTYANGGEYTISIWGQFDYVFFNDNPLPLIEVKEFGIAKLGAASFRFCSNLVEITSSTTPSFSDTSLSGLFQDCSSLTYINLLNSWDVSTITSLFKAFGSCSNFNQSLTGWNTTNVTIFASMFEFCTSFNSPVFFIFSSATNINSMFSGASSFNQNIDNWDIGNASILNLFTGCTNFNQPLNSWDVSHVTNMSFTFAGCTNFNQPLNNWDVSSCLVFQYTFSGCSSFNQDISGWNTASAVVFNLMFNACTSFDQNLGGWNVTNLTAASNMFSSVTLSTANYDALLIGWEGQAVNNGVGFSAGFSKYTSGGAAETARTNLLNDHSWVISDGGPV